MTFRHRLWVALAAWFLAGAVSLLAAVGVLLPQSLVPSAAANHCVLDGDFGTEGTIEQLGWNNSDEASGTQANASVGDAVTLCQRISSVYVVPKRPGLYGVRLGDRVVAVRHGYLR